MLLRPVLRFCLKRSLKFQEFVQISKLELVHLALGELEGDETSISKLSAATGLQRKDIRQLLQPTKITGTSNVITRISGMWMQSRRFATASGKPRALTYLGAESEFAKLVRGISSDLSHHTVIHEMERLGVAKRRGSKVVLIQPSVPLKNDDGYRAVAQDMDDLFRAADLNLTSGVQHLHARTSFDKIPASALSKIQSWVFEMGKRIHAEARRELARHDRDINPGKKPEEKTFRVTLGTFSFCEEVENNDPEDS